MSAPTIVLVHGNFLGPWSWSDVAAKLHDIGFRTVTPDLPSADPRRQPWGDLHADAATVRDALDLLQPPVLLCGHSYGGAVITEAAAGSHPAVRHLVYLAGAVPDEGDTLAGLTSEPPQGVREQAAARETGGEAGDRPSGWNDRTEARLRPQCTVPRLRTRAGSGGDRPAPAEQPHHRDPASNRRSVARCPGNFRSRPGRSNAGAGVGPVLGPECRAGAPSSREIGRAHV